MDALPRAARFCSRCGHWEADLDRRSCPVCSEPLPRAIFAEPSSVDPDGG